MSLTNWGTWYINKNSHASLFSLICNSRLGYFFGMDVSFVSDSDFSSFFSVVGVSCAMVSASLSKSGSACFTLGENISGLNRMSNSLSASEQTEFAACLIAFAVEDSAKFIKRTVQV